MTEPMQAPAPKEWKADDFFHACLKRPGIEFLREFAESFVEKFTAHPASRSPAARTGEILCYPALSSEQLGTVFLAAVEKAAAAPEENAREFLHFAQAAACRPEGQPSPRLRREEIEKARGDLEIVRGRNAAGVTRACAEFLLTKLPMLAAE